MKITRKILSLSILLILITTSCSESFLKPEPLSFYTSENVLTNEAGLQAVLDNALKSLCNECTGDISPITENMRYSDIAVDGTTDKTTPFQDLNRQLLPDAVFNAGWTKMSKCWDNSYATIKDCNTVIARSETATFTSEESKNQLLSGAYFLRAFRYYMKTLEYGDVPFVLEELTVPKTDFFTTTKESIWPKMIKDLEWAVQYLPEADKVNRGQVTKAACKHLLAKYYLLEGRFDDAIAITTEIIDGGVYALNTERFGSDASNLEKDVVWDMFRSENKCLASNKEGLLMTVDRYGVEGASNGVNTMRVAVPNYGQVGIIKTPDGANGMSDKAGCEIGLVEKYGRGVTRVRPTWYSQHGVWTINGVEDHQDYRHKTSNGNWITMDMLVYNNPALKTSGNEYYGKNLRLYSESGTLLCLDTIRCWHDWPHYKVWNEDPEEVRPQGGPADWYIFRLAETYLLRAEAYVWTEQWQKAADDINIIRKRANAIYMYTAEDIASQQIGAVLDERNRELYMEEPRKVEITRMAIIFARTGKQCYNGKTYSYDNLTTDNFYYDRVVEISDFYNKPNAVTVKGNYYTISPYHIFWPIPAYAINANSRGVINQNYGYPGTENNIDPLVYSEE